MSDSDDDWNVYDDFDNSDEEGPDDLEQIDGPNELIVSRIYKIKIVPSSAYDNSVYHEHRIYNGVYKYLGNGLDGNGRIYHLFSSDDGAEINIKENGTDQTFAIATLNGEPYMFTQYENPSPRIVPIDVKIYLVRSDGENFNRALRNQANNSNPRLPNDLMLKIGQYFGGKKRRKSRKSRKHKKTSRRNKRRNRKTKRRRR